MSRVEARESAFRLIYRTVMLNQHQQDALFCDENAINQYLESEKINVKSEDIEYLKEILSGIDENKDELHKIISENLIDWSVDRLSKILYSVLLLSLYEIFYRKDIPNEVSANEGVKLAKLYDTPEGASFINGILGNIISKL